MLNEGRVEEFTELMIAEERCYDTLLDRSRAHHEALLSGDPKEVESSLHAQIQALEGCRTAGEARLKASQTLSRSMGLGEGCRAGKLIASLPDDGGVLAGSHGRLKERSRELQELNGFNRRLTEHRLDLMQGDFVSMQSLIARAAGRTGENGEPVEGSLISLKA